MINIACFDQLRKWTFIPILARCFTMQNLHIHYSYIYMFTGEIVPVWSEVYETLALQEKQLKKQLNYFSNLSINIFIRFTIMSFWYLFGTYSMAWELYTWKTFKALIFTIFNVFTVNHKEALILLFKSPNYTKKMSKMYEELSLTGENNRKLKT
mgnify:CR=1 FL=1